MTIRLRLCSLAFLLLAAPAAAEPSDPGPEWRYTLRPGDTLIGVSARYLARPADWPRVQRHNRIANPLSPGSRQRLAHPARLAAACAGAGEAGKLMAADAQFGPLLLEHASAAPRPSFADLPDHGPGIAAADQARLFRRFSRAAERTTGTGLGLYFVRTVAEKHGGTVAVASEAGTFSRFTLRLPLSGLSSPAGAAAAQ